MYNIDLLSSIKVKKKMHTLSTGDFRMSSISLVTFFSDCLQLMQKGVIIKSIVTCLSIKLMYL